MDLKYEPIEPGIYVDLVIKPVPEVEVVALAFADGWVLGSAITREGVNVMADIIFGYRIAELKEFKRWQSLLLSQKVAGCYPSSDYRHTHKYPTGGEVRNAVAGTVHTAGVFPDEDGYRYVETISRTWCPQRKSM
jgi:hypothetical protein